MKRCGRITKCMDLYISMSKFFNLTEIVLICTLSLFCTISGMFHKPNPLAFQLVSYFLLTLLKANKYLSYMKVCFPCRDKSQENDFRTNMADFVKSLEKVR